MFTQQLHRQLLVLPQLRQIDFKCYICKEKYTREYAIFLESLSKRVTVLERISQTNSNNLKGVETSIERSNLNINSHLSSLEILKESVDLLKQN